MKQLMSAKGLSAVFQDAVMIPWNMSRAAWSVGRDHASPFTRGVVAVAMQAAPLMMGIGIGSIFNSAAVGAAAYLVYAHTISIGTMLTNDRAMDIVWPKTRALLKNAPGP